MMDWPSWVPQAVRENFLEGITLVAFVGAGKFLWEYIRDNRRKRLKHYGELRREFRSNQDFSVIFDGLSEYAEADEAKDEKQRVIAGEKLAGIKRDIRSEFAAFLEDIAMGMQSGALKPRVAHYMFGYYVILCWKTEPFWAGKLRSSEDDPYWALLRSFAERMERYEKRLERAPRLVVWLLRV
jgi:hypothetical protein